jgi:hypothetical protein
VRDRDTFVGLEAILAPPLAEAAAIATDDLDRREVGVADVVSGGEDQRVEFGLATIGRRSPDSK